VKLIHAIGAKGAILGSIVLLERKQQSEEGWIYKTQLDLEKETGLSRHEQNKCVEDLKKKNVLETRYERLDHRLYYRINRDALDEIMEGDLPGEIRKPDFAKTGKRISRNRQNRFRYKEAREYNREHTQEKRRRRPIKTPRAIPLQALRRRRFFLAG
jgi:hypothetical protein